MTRAQRIAFAVVGVALAGVVGVIVWLTLRGDQPEAAPIPPAGEARVVVADPSIELRYLVEVPQGAGGCPAATFRSQAEPEMPPVDGSTAVRLPGEGAFMVACIGDVDDVGTPEELVADLWAGDADGTADGASWERVSVERVSSAHGDALALTSRIGGKVLTDHYVVRDGWVHAVGYLRRDGSGDADRALFDAMLASWEWQ